jgi:hypothetical protein
VTGISPVPAAGRRTQDPAQLLDNWLAIQGINLLRHARSLRAFDKDEFGTGPAAPGEAHVEAVNRFLDGLRLKLLESARWVEAAVNHARRDPSQANLAAVLTRKEQVGMRVLYVEGIWDFYYDLFVQRLSRFGERLRTVDRIGANCYEDLYLGLAGARPTPLLLPFSYADAGFSPATYRRGVPLRRLRHHPNLFPLVTIPQHRLDNVWAMSSVLHEISHNLQADLGLWGVMPRRIEERLTRDGGLSSDVAQVFAAWHKETTADMFALLLGGPAAIESLMDVVGRSRKATVTFSPGAVHPTPVLRVLLSTELLARLGLRQLAADMRSMWTRLYPDVTSADIPAPVLRSFDRAAELVVDTIVFQPHPELSGRSLADTMAFGDKELAMIEEGGRRLAAGTDVGTLPPRFMISAARFAIDRRLATPQAITDNFYRMLGRR